MSAQTQKRFPVFTYLSEVQEELKRVSWPNRKQTLEKTSLVIIVSILVGAYIGALDYVFTQLTAVILK